MTKIAENNQTPVVEENKTEETKVAVEEKKNNSIVKEPRRERRDDRRPPRAHLKREVLEGPKRVVKATKGGRRFSFTSLVLIKDEEKKSIAYACEGGKETMTALQKSFRKAQKKLVDYFATRPHTIPRDIVVKYNATKLILKPAPLGSGIKAGEILSKIFKYLEIKDVSAKIIGSRNKLNVVRAAFLALDQLTKKKYDY